MWRTLRQLISETGNYQIQAMGELEECRSIAAEMRRYRVSSYRLLEQKPQESSEEEYRDQAKRALNQFALLAGLNVDLAQTATSQAVTLVEGR